MSKKEQNLESTTDRPIGYEPVLATGLNDAARKIHKAAKEKGFWDKPRETGTLLMLCVSELSEALEADRKKRYADLTPINNLIKEGYTWEDSPVSFDAHFKNIKDTFEDELADTIIRILDLCGAKGIDIEKHIELKLAYNKTRDKMHGKAY